MPSDLPEVHALNLIRLDHDWSIRHLAERMKAHGCPIGERTLYYHLIETGRRPYDRTLHKIRVYLAHLEQAEAKRRRKQAAGIRARRVDGAA